MTFHASSETPGGSALVSLTQAPGEAAVEAFRAQVDHALRGSPSRLVVDVRGMPVPTAAGLRCLAFAQQQLPGQAQVFVVGASPAFREALRLAGLDTAVTVVDEPANPA
ncbi:STAS domain-containing protein [Streptomyces sp. NPDC049879]|uniref:STAS domain-containing protein n=1 Tax=Streptomyces sp. NPDC049879 TaxID=3365598 RepID=UPI0037B4C110